MSCVEIFTSIVTPFDMPFIDELFYKNAIKSCLGAISRVAQIDKKIVLTRRKSQFFWVFSCRT